MTNPPDTLFPQYGWRVTILLQDIPRYGSGKILFIEEFLKLFREIKHILCHSYGIGVVAQ